MNFKQSCLIIHKVSINQPLTAAVRSQFNFYALSHPSRPNVPHITRVATKFLNSRTVAALTYVSGPRPLAPPPTCNEEASVFPASAD